MTILRVVLYGLLGAAAAALAAYLFFLRTLLMNGADPGLIPLPTLLLDVMGLARFALLGGLLGAVLAPFAPRERYSSRWVLWWLPLGICAGLLAPFVEAVFALQRLPTGNEFPALLRLDWVFLAAGSSAALVLALVELGYGLLMRRQHRRAEESGAEFRDVDGVLREYWQERADRYLSQRRAGQGSREAPRSE